MSNDERRGHNRYLCADLVRVQWFESEGPHFGQTLEAVLEDISTLGACVQVDRSIPLNSPITLSIGKASFRGGVCYSVFRDYGFFVGIRFFPGQRMVASRGDAPAPDESSCSYAAGY